MKSLKSSEVLTLRKNGVILDFRDRVILTLKILKSKSGSFFTDPIKISLSSLNSSNNSVIRSIKKLFILLKNTKLPRFFFSNFETIY